MEKLLVEVGIAIEKIEIRDVEVDFEKWVQMTGTKAESMEVIKGKLIKDINEGTETGMRPFMLNDSLKFLQTWSVIIGTKTSNTKRA